MSDPLSVPKTAKLMLDSGIPAADVERVTWQNALDAYGQSGQIDTEALLAKPVVDQTRCSATTRCYAASPRESTSPSPTDCVTYGVRHLSAPSDPRGSDGGEAAVRAAGVRGGGKCLTPYVTQSVGDGLVDAECA